MDAALPERSAFLAQRARGRLAIAFRAREGETVLDRLRQEGCLKARLPRPLAATPRQAILINTAGGITGGDDLETTVTVAAGARAVLTTQAAERLYRSSTDAPAASIRTALSVAAEGDLAWLPQETILFEDCRVDRRLAVDLAPTARFLGLETLIFGRLAMEERLRRAALRDRITIRRDGRLLFQDMLRLEGDLDALLARAATAADGRAVATLVMVAPEVETFVTPLREMLAARADGVESGATAWNSLLLMRLLSPDPVRLRGATIAALALLRAGEALPRVWHL